MLHADPLPTSLPRHFDYQSKLPHLHADNLLANFLRQHAGDEWLVDDVAGVDDGIEQIVRAVATAGTDEVGTGHAYFVVEEEATGHSVISALVRRSVSGNRQQDGGNDERACARQFDRFHWRQGSASGIAGVVEDFQLHVLGITRHLGVRTGL